MVEYSESEKRLHHHLWGLSRYNRPPACGWLGPLSNYISLATPAAENCVNWERKRYSYPGMFLTAVQEENLATIIPPANYCRRAFKEGNTLISQLRRKFGEEPLGALFHIITNDRSFNGEDFGQYLTVICFYEIENQVAKEYALKCESEFPEVWDEEACKELNIPLNFQEGCCCDGFKDITIPW